MQRILKATVPALVGLVVGCAEVTLDQPQATVRSGSINGQEIEGTDYAIYFEGALDYDTDGDGANDYTLKYLQVLASNHPDLCGDVETGAPLDDLVYSYVTGYYFGPLGTALPDFAAGQAITGDYEQTWVDQGVVYYWDNVLYAYTVGIGDGTLSISDIGEAAVSGTSDGVMYFDFSGQYPFDYDYDKDGAADSTFFYPTPISTTFNNADRCDWEGIEGEASARSLKAQVFPLAMPNLR